MGDFLDIGQEMERLKQTWDVTVEAVIIETSIISEKSPCQCRACLSAPWREEMNLISRVKGLWLSPAPKLLSKLGSPRLPPKVSM